MALRLTIMTLNVWGSTRWPERAGAMAALMRRLQPDILCIQEAAAAVQDTIASALPTHARAGTGGRGWDSEGNIFYRTDWFSAVEAGEADIGGIRPGRQLFWARLRAPGGEGVVVSTAHFAWPGHKEEAETGLSPRVRQSKATAAALAALARDDDTVFFTGDLNEAEHPRKILRAAGFEDCFTALAMPCAPTRPAHPVDTRPDEVCDWIFARGPAARPVAAMIHKSYHQGLPASDHWPLLAVYELGA